MIEIPVPLLILQHPQEPNRKDQEISSAPILARELKYCRIVPGLSWRNLKHALKGWAEFENHPEFSQPSTWATLYLGTKKQSQAELDPGIYFLNKKGDLAVDSLDEPPSIGGLILLDGTWSQAKTLWWRNPWLLKTKRLQLVPKEKSKYGHHRKEPRPECVSTIEAVAETLSFLGIDPSVEARLKEAFKLTLKQRT